MRRLLNWLSRRRFPYEPLINVEISRSRLIYNLDEFRKLAPHGSVAPVLKSNAYGHGLMEIASILEKESRHARNIPFFAVDSYFEAIALRVKWIRTPILVIGYTRPETIIRSRLKKTSFTITSMEMLRKLCVLSDPSSDEHSLNNTTSGFLSFAFRRIRMCRIHLKIDTGMRRQGILPEEISEATELINRHPLIVLEGICSHLSDADNTDDPFTEEQIGKWNHSVKIFKEAFPSIKYFHISNTDGHHFGKDIDANVSRLGIGLYGICDNPLITCRSNLQPVLEMKTIITGIKKLRIGEKVGYGNTFTAPHDMTIATISAGYFEGIDRRLSNIGTILVGEKRLPCPIVGRVSMNITIFDVSKVHDIKEGDPAVIISRNTDDANSIVSIARLCKTISYDIAVKIASQTRRVIVD